MITDQTEPPNSETRHRTSPRAHPRPTPPPPRPPLSPRRVGRPRGPPQPPQWALKPPPPAGSGPSPPGPGPGGGGWPCVRPPMAEPGSGGDFWLLRAVTEHSQPRTSAGRSPIVAQSTRFLVARRPHGHKKGNQPTQKFGGAKHQSPHAHDWPTARTYPFQPEAAARPRACLRLPSDRPKRTSQRTLRDDRWPQIGWGGATRLTRGVRGTSRRVPAAVQVFFFRGFRVAAFGLWSLSAPSSL